jgi:6-phosphogluconolactonase (cycloisomerase 2 family)
MNGKTRRAVRKTDSMKTKTNLIHIIALLGISAALLSSAAEPFKVYAPSSKTQTLWIVDAIPKVEGGLELKLAEKRDIGIKGWVIAAHPTKPLLYIAGGGGERGKVPGAVVTLASNRGYASHQRIELNDDSAYLSLDRSGSFLFGVSYGSGRLNVHRLGDDGTPGKAVATVDEGRKEAHCVLISPDNQFLYIPYVKSNLALFQYRFDAASGSVTPLDPLDANPPKGTGPRHLVYHPTLPLVYFTNEQGIGLSTYERRPDGQLVLKQDIAILPEGMSKDGLSASDLEITPDGKFIFAGLRGHSQDFDRIVRYRVREDGQAELLGLTPADRIPWGLALSPDAEYLLVSAYNGATLTAYRITSEGALEKAASLSWDAEISDLLTLAASSAARLDLSKVSSRAELDGIIASTTDVGLQRALREHAAAILGAAKQHPHVESVIRTIEGAPGSFTKVNTTPEALKAAAGGDIAIFDTLTMVNTGIFRGHAHASRDQKTDPYDAAFIEHLGHISSLENLSIVVTAFDESSLDHVLKLKRLKSLRIEKRYDNGPGDSALAKLSQLQTCPDLRSLSLHYFSRATDAGLEHLAGLKNLETFSFRGSVPGHAFAKFEGWTNLKSIAFHGNAIDDEGLGHICERFPNLESLNLIHARSLTDASAVHLPKLKKLKRIILNGGKMTAAWHGNLGMLPLESLSVSQGNSLPTAQAIAGAKAIPSLRHFAMDGKTLTDTDLTTLAGVSQIQELSLMDIELYDSRLLQMRAFAHLKTLSLVRYGKGYPDETQAKIKALLPNVDVKFVK